MKKLISAVLLGLFALAAAPAFADGPVVVVVHHHHAVHHRHHVVHHRHHVVHHGAVVVVHPVQHN